MSGVGFNHRHIIYKLHLYSGDEPCYEVRLSVRQGRSPEESDSRAVAQATLIFQALCHPSMDAFNAIEVSLGGESAEIVRGLSAEGYTNLSGIVKAHDGAIVGECLSTQRPGFKRFDTGRALKLIKWSRSLEVME